SRRRHTRSKRDWSSDVCSSDLNLPWKGRVPHFSSLTLVLISSTHTTRINLSLLLRSIHLSLSGFSVGKIRPPLIVIWAWCSLLRSEERRVGKECGSRRWECRHK